MQHSEHLIRIIVLQLLVYSFITTSIIIFFIYIDPRKIAITLSGNVRDSYLHSSLVFYGDPFAGHPGMVGVSE